VGLVDREYVDHTGCAGMGGSAKSHNRTNRERAGEWTVDGLRRPTGLTNVRLLGRTNRGDGDVCQGRSIMARPAR
jgi:hypothetical protein